MLFALSNAHMQWARIVQAWGPRGLKYFADFLMTGEACTQQEHFTRVRTSLLIKKMAGRA